MIAAPSSLFYGPSMRLIRRRHRKSDLRPSLQQEAAERDGLVVLFVLGGVKQRDRTGVGLRGDRCKEC